jgi:polyphosphate kinase 2
MGKGKKKKDKRKRRDAEGMAPPEQIVAGATADDTRADTSAGPMKRREYEAILKGLHVELVKLQEWVKATGTKICIVFEGRDGAGKGGTIKAITARCSPRVFRVVALPAPSDREKTQMYIQRYLPHLPAGGEVVIFDRSWYNRAGVERVMGFCTDDQVKDFLFAAPFVERAIIHSGVILLKYWLEVSPAEQTERLRDRIDDGRKIWKLSPMDVLSYTRWHDYTHARDEMFKATDTEFAPWHVIDSNDKRRAHLNLISHLLSRVPYQEVAREKVKLPERYIDPETAQGSYPMRYVESIY